MIPLCRQRHGMNEQAFRRENDFRQRSPSSASEILAGGFLPAPTAEGSLAREISVFDARRRKFACGSNSAKVTHRPFLKA
ncbi:hypothetical protein [Rhizobium bangladeshense]|uniref:hypothetical protein n=1 Tax=Rhizobium bangladeshense TaxID=1138189 RepID=UPI001C82CBF0|nr:hypothetical protein [Rhizobium bangladeshense]MBX4872537.1 hypothetical protein [Rhizobium bangladeshense]MBX4883854.1 hypothetical protein [Rhizobium bangladeshense]MBX4889949.1 hypothetical protein [Rhizobium bangladeshense]MBX4913654.1 hypothetical protein [Rhizobium bangladeshense]MBX4920824.1 hypothetical protein [Rhizobium bangladeshense]